MVERFHRTLDDELLRYVQPLNDRHLNRLLTEFRKYYNTARPHMANGAEPPVLPDITLRLLNGFQSDDQALAQYPDSLRNAREL